MKNIYEKYQPRTDTDSVVLVKKGKIIRYWEADSDNTFPAGKVPEKPPPKIIGYNKDGIPMVRRIGSGPRPDLVMLERDKSHKPRKKRK